MLESGIHPDGDAGTVRIGLESHLLCPLAVMRLCTLSGTTIWTAAWAGSSKLSAVLLTSRYLQLGVLIFSIFKNKIFVCFK